MTDPARSLSADTSDGYRSQPRLRSEATARVGPGDSLSWGYGLQQDPLTWLGTPVHAQTLPSAL